MKHQADRTRRAALPPFGRNPATAPHNGLNSRSRWAATYLGGRSSDLSHAPKRLPTKPRQWQWLYCFDVQRDSQQRVLSPTLTAFPLGRALTSGPPSATKLRKTFLRRTRSEFIFLENFLVISRTEVVRFWQLATKTSARSAPSATARRTTRRVLKTTSRLTETTSRLIGTTSRLIETTSRLIEISGRLTEKTSRLTETTGRADKVRFTV